MITLCRRKYGGRTPEFFYIYFFKYENGTYGDCEFKIKRLFSKDLKRDRKLMLDSANIAGGGEIEELASSKSIEEMKYSLPWLFI